MVPRVDVVTMRADDPALSLVALLDTGHSRFPVIAEGVDDVVGVASMTDLIALPVDRRRTARARDIAVQPLLVPQSLPLPDVLERLRDAHRQLAVVVDEHGGFAGLVTLEDVVEELVGAIRDEDDPPEPAVTRQTDGSWLVPGRWRLDEITSATGVALPETRHYDTVSGLVMYHLGRVPAVDDRLELEDGLVLHVVAVERHVPAIVRIVVSAMAS
jgi:CBS domain containing-hemolysin-like protein